MKKLEKYRKQLKEDDYEYIKSLKELEDILETLYTNKYLKNLFTKLKRTCDKLDDYNPDLTLSIYKTIQSPYLKVIRSYDIEAAVVKSLHKIKKNFKEIK